MTNPLGWFHEYYDRNDPRTSQWFLISRPWSLIAIMLLYIYFCTSAGPKYMKNKPPYSLRTTLIVYNFVQVLFSVYIVYEALMGGWLYEYDRICQPVDYSESPTAMRMAGAAYLYFTCKIIELLDTVFFVFRKKDRQISFLHLYHHATMPVLAWIGVRYFPGGHPTLLGMTNSFVHIFMYGYYFLAAFGPEVQKYLWWKKHLTKLQMLQFFVVGVHSLQMLFTDCNFPKMWSLLIALNDFLFLYMFGTFYIKNHIKRNPISTEIKKPHVTNSKPE